MIGCAQVGEMQIRALGERGPVEASRMVGETMVRNLTAINPSIRHQFPALFT